MKQLKIYPLAKVTAPPAMEFMNGSGRAIDTVFPDNFRFFELLAMLVNEEPADIFDPLERSMMLAIGIEKGKAFNPDAKVKALLAEAAQLGGAMARANSYTSKFCRFYPDRNAALLATVLLLSGYTAPTSASRATTGNSAAGSPMGISISNSADRNAK